MTTTAAAIARALRRPVLRRPIVGQELRHPIVQLRGAASDVLWQATVPQLAEALAEALQHEEKDIPVGGQPSGTASTARAQVLAALRRAGHDEEAAADLLARALCEPHADQPDTEFPESLAGGHALIVEYGDCELIGSCQCSRRLGTITPNASVDLLAALWERHTTREAVARG